MAPALALLSGAFLLFSGIFAHPGHSVKEEAAERMEFMKRSPRTVRSCASDLSRREHITEAIARRREVALYARADRGLGDDVPMLSRRDFAAYNFTHASNKSVSLGSDETLLFDDNSSCMLQSEVTQGPYYVDGELIRTDITDRQEGVPLYLLIQLVDTSTCEPVPAMFVDIWHCNATGVYSGVVANGNGNANDSTNLDATFLRGIQETDVNGILQVDTIFPGHYTGRATHIHVLAHALNDTIIRTNHTVLGSNFTAQASHVGQIFFDESLRSKVEVLAPYSDNTQPVTLNSEDDILLSETDSSDPFVEYVQLSTDLSDGLMAWITIGIDPTADDAITSAGTYYADGGVANEDSNIGMPPGGNGTMSGLPSGASGVSLLPSSSAT